MKRIFSYIASVVLVGVVTLGFTANAMADQKIGVVDVQQVLTEVPQTKQVAADIKKQFAARESKLKADQKTLQADQAKLDKDAAVMAAKDRSALQDRIISEKSAFQGHVAAFQQDVNSAQSTAMQGLLNKIKTAVGDFARKQGYTLIVTKNSVAYAANEVDVTQQVIAAMKSAK